MSMRTLNEDERGQLIQMAAHLRKAAKKYEQTTLDYIWWYEGNVSCCALGGIYLDTTPFPDEIIPELKKALNVYETQNWNPDNTAMVEEIRREVAILVLDELGRRFPILKGKVYLEFPVRQVEGLWELPHIITELNDEYNWSFTKIANYLKGLAKEGMMVTTSYA